MKREGRQHGTVRTHVIPAFNPRPDEPRVCNKLNTPPTAGLFTKVSRKPTNHSKFTGKCGKPKCASCHINPACKAKVKAKGNHKIRSNDLSLTLWVAGSGPGLKYSGFSATGLLEQLSSENDHYIDHYDEDNNYEDNEIVNDDCEESFNLTCPELIIHSEISSPGVEIMEEDDYKDEDEDEDEYEDEEMSFCDVGIIWEQVYEDEDWCIVEEM